MKRSLRSNQTGPQHSSHRHPNDYTDNDIPSPPRSFLPSLQGDSGGRVDSDSSSPYFTHSVALDQQPQQHDLDENRQRRYGAYNGNDYTYESRHALHDYGVDEEEGYHTGGLSLPLYNTAMGGTPGQPDLSTAYGQEAVQRRRAGVPGSGSAPMTEEETALLYTSDRQDANRYENEDDDGGQGKQWGSKGFGPGMGMGGRRGLPPQRPKPVTWQQHLVYHEEIVWTVVYTLLAMFTRYYKIGIANYVVWDEAHFGKFGSHYINQDFYFDVHPPLGKMLVGLAGLLSGYGGGFDFKSGATYPPEVPYTAMRVMLATFGAAMVPIAWWTAGEFGWSRKTRHWVTLCVLCDVAWITISRFILLDSMLLFFTFTTVLGMVKFHNQRHDPFGDDWWLWIVFTGLSIGCVCSVKWVGLFATALVGVYTVEDLWDKFGDLRMPFRTYIRHWAARVGCLIVLPFCVYAMCFKLHFLILNRSGPGDAQMSSLFQAHLRGNDFAESPLEIAYGSRVTVKNYGYGGGLLHSHVQTFPVGSMQQQVTCYHYKDDNNNWVISPTWDEPPVDDEKPIRYVQDGSVVRLVHGPTTRNLHSHTVPAPITKNQWEVACYGNSTVGDVNDNWVVEVVDDMHQGKRANVDKIHALTTRIRFRHQTIGCYLRAANEPLPQWGFKQIEVTCDPTDNPKDVHTYWNIESHWNDRLPKGDAKLYRSPFWRDFWHLNVAMMTSNNALVPDPDKDDILASKPTDWPVLKLGLRMCGWADNQIKYYLLGNPFIWWFSTASLFIGLALFAFFLIRIQRQYKDWEKGEWEHWLYVAKVGFLGWFFQYIPYLIMGRVTYLHHYLPTLWFAVLTAGHVLDTIIFSNRRLSPTTKWIAFAITSGLVVGISLWFRAIAFGMHGPAHDYWGLRWRKTWNLYDGPQ